MSRFDPPVAAQFPVSTGQLGVEWKEDSETEMLRHVWQAYDELNREGVPAEVVDDEDAISFRLHNRLQRLVPRESPFIFAHKPPELSTRRGRRSSPPTPDYGFVLNDEIVFPLEAKLLHNSSHVTKYVNTLRNRYLTGKYAPRSLEGAMVAYINTWTENRAFNAIQSKLGKKLELPSAFQDRPYRITKHERRKLRIGRLKGGFRCHHLLMRICSQLQTEMAL